MAIRHPWPTRRAEPDASTRSRGARVEAAAREHLVRAGLEPVAANAGYRVGELDLVMCDGGTLVFVEVRYRADDRFGGGAQSITAAKRRKLVRAASLFLATHPRWADAPCRFDVVEATGNVGHPELTWLRDAFRADDF